MWVVFKNGKAGFFEIENGIDHKEFPGYKDRTALDAWYERNRVATEKRYAEVLQDYCLGNGTDVAEKWSLPYPASPKLHSDYPKGEGCPTFCHDANGECKNRSSCPKRHACSD